jgi:uncharacterized membrane protein (UPF0127 family)
MKSFLKFFVVIAFVAIFIFLLKPDPKQIKPDSKPNPYHQIDIGGQFVKVILATTPTEQERGLSGRLGLSENSGMLFVFDKPGKYNFWMKDMKFAIDIIWIESVPGDPGYSKISYIKKNAQPESYPNTFGPGTGDSDATYVLEVNSGFADKNNLKVGDIVVLE